MVLDDAVHEVGAPLELAVLHDLEAVDNVILQNIKLFFRQKPLLFKKVLRNHLLADVEEESCQHHILTVDADKSHPACHKPAEDGEMDAVMQVVVALLIHAVHHRDGCRPLLVEVAQAAARHHALQDAHVELTGLCRLGKEFLHLAVDVAVVLFVFVVQFDLAFGGRAITDDGCLFFLDRLFLLNGSDDAVLIDVDRGDPLFLEQLDRLFVQYRAALDEHILTVPIVDGTSDQHFRQKASYCKRFQHDVLSPLFSDVTLP